jgi:predicted RNA-binding protein with PUA-like domain
MGFLRTDYSNTGDFAPLPIGEYECFVSKVETTESSNGNPMLKVTLTVRDDVEQPGQKRKFFDNMVETEKMMWKFNQVAKAAQLEEGVDLETLADFAAAIQYKPVRIKNKHEVYNGETNDRIAILERKSIWR